MKQFNLVILLLTATILALAQAEYVNNPCTDRYSGKPGICKIIRECPAARDKIRKGQRPSLCGFIDRTTPIVCCEGLSGGGGPSYGHQENRPVFGGVSSGQGSVSGRKCEEYAKETVSTISFLPLLVHGEAAKINVTKCSKDGLFLVVGGKPAVPGEFPFMAALGYEDGDYKCGGTLISDNFVLTAAHCMTRRSFGEPVKVKLGTVNLIRDDDESSPLEVEIEDVIIHPQYRPTKKPNDIALVKLKRKVPFNKFIKPACLYTRSQIESKHAIAMGWGTTSFAGESSLNSLQQVILDILPNSKCESVYNVGGAPVYSSTMLCAGVLAGDRDTCQGDSGGPLVITRKGNNCVYYVVGITSFGKSCGQAYIPAVYTRVSEFIPWIEKIVWNG